MNMFLQDHKSLSFTRIGIFSLELMPAYSVVLYSACLLLDMAARPNATAATENYLPTDFAPP